MAEDILFYKKVDNGIKFVITEKRANSRMEDTYKKTVINKDYNSLAFLFYDLWTQGYPIEKAYNKFKEFINDKDGLFFTK